MEPFHVLVTSEVPQGSANVVFSLLVLFRKLTLRGNTTIMLI